MHVIGELARSIPMITSLSLKNFKSWHEIDAMRLAPITGVFGANSSGKTSILQSLLLLKQTTESSDRAAVLDFGGERSAAQLGGFRDVIFGHSTEKILGFSVDWVPTTPLNITDPDRAGKSLFTSEGLGFSTQIGMNSTGKLAVEKLEYRLDGPRFTMQQLKQGKAGKYDLHSEGSGFDFKRTVGRPWDLPAPVKCYGFPDQAFAYFLNASFLGDLQLSFEQLFSHVYYLGPLRDFPQRHYTWSGSEPADMGRRGERAIDAILASRERGKYISPGYRKKKQTLDERIAHWLQEMGLIESFTVRPIAKESKLYEVRVRKSSKASEVLITDVGFGVSQVLPVLVLCNYVPEGSTVLLEQPEIHLHPGVQSALADMLIDAVQNRKIQVILESHSEHLLRRIQLRIAEEKLEPKDCALYFCDVIQGESALIPLNLDDFGNIQNWPKEFFGDEFGEMAAKTKAAMNRRKQGGAV